MKRIFVIFAVFAAAISCNKEQVNNSSELVPLSFRAETVATRSALHQDGTSIIWSTSDRINVFSGEAFGTNSEFSATSVSEDQTVATFEGLGQISPEYYALFPYQAGATISPAGIITAELPSSQNAADGSFGPEANLSVAHIAGDETLKFMNAGALLSVVVNEPDVTWMKIESLNGSYLSGTAEIDYNGGEPSVNILSGNTFVETAVDGAGTYYLVVFPGSFDGGFKITFSRNGYTASVNNTTALHLDRNDNVRLIEVPAIPAEAWKVVFTPGEKVYIRGLSDENEDGQEVTYISSSYYAPREGGQAPNYTGDNQALAGVTYNYEVWAKLAETDAVYFETESGARFAINFEGTEVAPIAPDGAGMALSVSDSPYRIRINLPSGEAQLARVGIVNYGVYTIGDISENLTYDHAGAWKAEDRVIRYGVQSWDPCLTRYRFSIWFNWEGGKSGGNIDVWQRYGTCTFYNNSNTRPVTDNPAEDYYFVQPFAADEWDQIFYMGSWLFSEGNNGAKKATINLYMNNDYGHFTHGFSNVVDNN
ncbi:MAG: hypothetical protein J5764_01165 [Bacteroidales bacterium]|nr:hypothetical protein [Bacteroidales bacterium]